MADPNFIDRINNPEKYPFLKNKDGSISTHRMAAEVDEEGNWFVFPTIIQTPGGSLHEFKDSQLAMDYAIRTGEALPMGSKKEALSYSKGGYKKGTALEKFNHLGK